MPTAFDRRSRKYGIFILTMPTAFDRRSGAVYGEKSPKTHLVRIYCYGNTLYIASLIAR